MKKISTIAGMLVGVALYALPVLNPGAPALTTDGVFFCDEGECWALRAGYRGDFVTNRVMKDNQFGSVDRFSWWANEGVLTLNLWEWVDIYGYVGAANYYIENEQSSNASNGSTTLLKGGSNNNAVWGVGLKLLLLEQCWECWGTTYVSVSGEYESYSRHALKWASTDGQFAATNGVGFEYREYQVALAVGHKIWRVIPYFGVQWAQSWASSGNNETIGPSGGNQPHATNLHTWRSKQPFGYSFGVTFVDVARMTVTGEARFKDENAFTVSAEFQF